MKKNTSRIGTKFALAKKLSISRTSLDKYLSMDGAPERAPDGWPLDAIVAFIAGRAESESVAGKTSDSIRSLKEREIFLKCARLQLRLDQERGRFVLKSDMCAAISKVLAEMRLLLRNALELEFPSQCAGLDVIQIRVLGKRLNDLILLKVQALADLLPE